MGLVAFSKCLFWKIFWPTWSKTLGSNKELIRESFKKTNIWPIDRFQVLPLINIKKSVFQLSTTKEIILLILPKTPVTSKSIRKIQRDYQLNPSPRKFTLLFKAQQRLVAQHEIDQHIQRGLFETIQDEKKRRKRGKRLNLISEEAGSIEL